MTMTMTQLVRHLRDLGYARRCPYRKDFGICYELRRLTLHYRLNAYDIKRLGTWMLDWPEAIGSCKGDYIVPARWPDGFSREALSKAYTTEIGLHGAAITQYKSTSDLWIGTYGCCRKRLCLYLADHLEHYIEEH